MVEIMPDFVVKQFVLNFDECVPEQLVEPISEVQRAQVIGKTQEFIALAEDCYQRKLPAVPIHFDLYGSTAGMYKIQGRQGCIRYNPWIFSKYFLDSLEGTVPHEVAHFAVDQVFRRSSVKPHGIEWRQLMAHFGADDEVTFKLDLTGIPQRKQQRHLYLCACQQHQLSATRHNRIRRRKGIYHCVNCDEKLVYDAGQ